MSQQLHDEGRREQSRRQQVKVRADEELVDDFDEWVEASEHDNRAAALRHAMRRCLGAADIERAPLVPPSDSRLRTAYLCLVDAANADGIVTGALARAELGTNLGATEPVVQQTIRRLHDYGYLRRRTNVYGTEAWALNGWDDR